MCQFKSFVATKDKLYHVNGLDSHEDIVAYYSLPDKLDRNRQPQIVRLELLPPDITEANLDDLLDPSKWTFRTDQDILPDWYVPDEWDAKCRLWVRDAPVLTGDAAIIDSWYLLVRGNIGKVVLGGWVRVLSGGTVQRVESGGTIVRDYSKEWEGWRDN